MLQPVNHKSESDFSMAVILTSLSVSDQCHYNRNTKIKLDARTKDEEMTKFDSVINRHSSSSLTTSELGKRGDRRTPRSHKFKFQGNSVRILLKLHL